MPSIARLVSCCLQKKGEFLVFEACPPLFDEGHDQARSTSKIFALCVCVFVKG